MTIEVTQADIDQGIRCKTLRCPIALAVARATGQEFVIGCDAVYALDGPIELPLAARRFISMFDGYFHLRPSPFRPVKPLTQ